MFNGESLISRIGELYDKIDSAYAAAAEKIDLTCEGCDGVLCCTVDLTLHTFVEMSYLRQGFYALDSFMQSEILTKSRRMVSAKQQAPKGERLQECGLCPEFRRSVRPIPIPADDLPIGGRPTFLY